jgi:hypothetical protein
MTLFAYQSSHRCLQSGIVQTLVGADLALFPSRYRDHENGIQLYSATDSRVAVSSIFM